MGSERLRTSQRLRKRFEYQAVQRESRRVHTPHFLILLSSRPGRPTRLGVIITKKTSPTAVLRNRVKRLAREVFRRNLDWFPPETDVVVIAKSGATELDYAAVAREVGGVTRRMRESGASSR